MEPETPHKVHVIVGIFTITCFAISFVYGWYVAVVWSLGMILLAALINAFSINYASSRY